MHIVTIKKYTKTKHVKYLNTLYSNMYSFEEAMEVFEHLSSELVIVKNYQNKTLGRLFKLKDPMLFDVSYNNELRNKRSK